MKKALIMGSEVVDVHETEFEVHPSMFWVDCDDDVQGGDRYVDGKIVKLEPPPIQYNEARVAEYPSLGDQLDAIWKGGEAEEEMRAKIMAVKAKFPKE